MTRNSTLGSKKEVPIPEVDFTAISQTRKVEDLSNLVYANTLENIEKERLNHSAEYRKPSNETGDIS